MLRISLPAPRSRGLAPEPHRVEWTLQHIVVSGQEVVRNVGESGQDDLSSHREAGSYISFSAYRILSSACAAWNRRAGRCRGRGGARARLQLVYAFDRTRHVMRQDAPFEPRRVDRRPVSPLPEDSILVTEQPRPLYQRAQSVRPERYVVRCDGPSSITCSRPWIPADGHVVHFGYDAVHDPPVVRVPYRLCGV